MMQDQPFETRWDEYQKAGGPLVDRAYILQLAQRGETEPWIVMHAALHLVKSEVALENVLPLLSTLLQVSVSDSSNAGLLAKMPVAIAAYHEGRASGVSEISEYVPYTPLPKITWFVVQYDGDLTWTNNAGTSGCLHLPPHLDRLPTAERLATLLNHFWPYLNGRKDVVAADEWVKQIRVIAESHSADVDTFYESVRHYVHTQCLVPASKISEILEISEQPTEGRYPYEGVDSFAGRVTTLFDGLRDLLIEKNKAYGNSALDPLNVFAQASAVDQLRTQIDHKLSRIKRGSEYQDEDTLRDLIGYLALFLLAVEDADLTLRNEATT